MATLNTNSIVARGTALDLTDETVVTLYVFEKTGTHGNHFVGLEASPDGTNWISVGEAIKGSGVQSYNIAASKVRAAVLEPERRTSTVDVFLRAR